VRNRSFADEDLDKSECKLDILSLIRLLLASGSTLMLIQGQSIVDNRISGRQ
jgi:hypothetical protein